MGLTEFFVLLLVLAAFAVAMVYVHRTRSQRLLQKWVRENGCELLNAEFRVLRKGPYWFSARGQVVYRVEVRDREGRMRTGWVRCGGPFSGVFGDKVEGRLDDIA